MKYNYSLIDAFTTQAFQGAPIIVFAGVSDFQDVQMQIIAQELNQAETVFIFPTDDRNVSKLRIFTPEYELGFGGHPVVAASYVLHKNNMISGGVHTFKLPVGDIDVCVSANEKIQFSVRAETKLDDFVPSAKELSEILHLDENDIDLSQYKVMISGCGEDYLIVPVKSTVQLNKARFSEDKWIMSFVATLAKQVLLFCENKSDDSVNYNARLFGKGIGVNEDPPIGTSVPAFGNYLFSGEGDGTYKTLVQRGDGERRISRIEIEVVNHQQQVSEIKVGGHAVMVGEGAIFLDAV